MTLKIVRRLIPEWGTTYGPPGDGPFPAIMVLHGSEGAWSGWSHRNAAIFAAHGFVAFPFGYAKNGNVWNAGNIVDVPLDRTAEALAAMRASNFIGPKIGIYGVSRGAEHALLLASLMATDNMHGQPDAIAVHSPPDVICGGFQSARWRDPGDPGWQVWDPADRAWTWRGNSDDLLPTKPIEIERYKGPLFLSHGTADKLWSVDMTRRLADRLALAGRDPTVQYYEGEDHSLGSAAENEHHERLLDFFQQHLAG
jgi:dipeptidyl aminopeptidase/acylaminoacyl peptidase